ncbi:LysR family transcriptional regulator [Cellulomonas sp. PhB143]|uniref:LysR family transcriptional regulator n=1 Tax=Cellulomonas sp. PhB143 TaxID=2485186 RepID=UPI000F466FBF|nr:LysR family transcriptional regulator [Cellulomonas sp. PhB143]ROS76755.1 LysR family transcriptional regulator [Cellulomonas sp. PhB143]
MRITLERLECFVAAARAGSFSAAARHLGKSQSTVSAAVANLEIDVGVDLFDRSTRSPTLTEAGVRLLVEAEAVVERGAGFERHADALALREATSVTVSVDVPTRILAPVFVELAKVFPYTNLTIHDPHETSAAHAVASGAAALGVAFAQPDYPGTVAFRQLGKLILVHVVHRDHPLAASPTVDFADLRTHRRLVVRGQAEAQPTTEYLRTAQTWQVAGHASLVQLATAGLGWATLPRQYILEELARGDLVELELAAYPHTDWLVGVDLLVPRDRAPSLPEAWLQRRLARFRVSERDRLGNHTAPLDTGRSHAWTGAPGRGHAAVRGPAAD